MPQDAVDLFMFAGFGIDKTCTKCKMPKPPDSFNKSQYCCRECQRAKYAAFYAANKDREKARAANHRAKYPEQHKITTAAWRAANKERHAEMQRRWREQNKERMRHYRAAQYEENRARENALARQWKALHREELALKAAERQRDHPELKRHYQNLRRARQMRATPAWTDPKTLLPFYQDAVAKTKETGIEHEVDHIVPLASPWVCGLHCEANLQVTPSAANRRKNNCTWPDMFDVVANLRKRRTRIERGTA